MGIEIALQIAEGRREAMEFVERAVARVAAGIVSLGPSTAGVIEVPELTAFRHKLTVESGATGFSQTSRVDERWEPGLETFHGRAG